MTLYELTKKYSKDNGEDSMWKTVAIVSKAVEESMPEKERESLMRNIYSVIADHHYNEQFAREDIAKMYYTDKSGEKQYGPYWSEEDLSELYEQYHDDIPHYNKWDFAVTMTMIKSDMCPLLKSWFPSASESDMTEKLVELSLNWLRDEDYNSSTKIWDYLNK